MKIAIEIVALYVLFDFTAAVLIWRYGVKDRAPFIIVAWLMPFLLVAALLHSAFLLAFGKRPKLEPCPYGLDEAELLVEKHRQKMFGGELIEPRFAHTWALLYRAALEEEARGIQEMAKRVLAYS